VPREGHFTVQGRVIAPRAPGIALVQLANGHTLVAHLPRRLRESAEPMVPGDQVWLRVSPCDLSQGLIMQNEMLES
jgi:translation initiation factor IF-1